MAVMEWEIFVRNGGGARNGKRGWHQKWGEGAAMGGWFSYVGSEVFKVLVFLCGM